MENTYRTDFKKKLKNLGSLKDGVLGVPVGHLN